ncbi:hypothetical protein V5799_028072 [Amblyomma americanum]|uniref:Uncharacterized protein n=1 Tax=Amblyomma americanum TaxID=6943 RepID=A0AAQ4DDX2_AMBAM
MASVLQVLVAASLLVFLASAVPQRTFKKNSQRHPSPARTAHIRRPADQTRSTSGQQRTTTGRPKGTYNFLIFCQQWSHGICADDKKCVESSKKDYWTIHGLWPQRKGFSHSPYDTVDFDDADLNPIKEDLNKYWPALRSPRKEYFEFWRFEWEKHGAYTFDIPQLNGTLNYFKSTLDLYHKYNIYELLFKAKITPSTDKNYSDGAIRNALPNDIRENVNIFCKQKTLPTGPLKGKTVSVLTEIHICVDKALKPVKCPQKNGGCGPANYYLKRESRRSHA